MPSSSGRLNFSDCQNSFREKSDSLTFSQAQNFFSDHIQYFTQPAIHAVADRQKKVRKKLNQILFSILMWNADEKGYDNGMVLNKSWPLEDL